MKLSELRAREDLDALLPPTLARGLSAMTGRNTHVTPAETRGAQAWLGHAFVSAYYTAAIGREGRCVLADELRYTPRRARAVPQWIIGTAVTTRIALRSLGTPAFWVEPALAHPEALLVIPGNQRIRVLDFAQDRSWVFLKQGFDATAIKTEVRVRYGSVGPFPTVTAHDADFTWLEEPLLHGYSLPRCPPWRDRRDLERRGIDSLDQYLATSATHGQMRDHTAHLVGQIHEAVLALQAEPGAPGVAVVADATRQLAHRANRIADVELADGHGDFQPGNIFVDRCHDRVWLIDWESAGRRLRAYDALTYGLAARGGRGLASRAERFISTGDLGPAGMVLPARVGATWRDATVATFLLEDVAWQAAQARAGRYLRVPSSLATLLDEVAKFLRSSAPR